MENLYFHNSHLRGPKPFVTPTPAIITTEQQPASFPTVQSAPAQSSLSFKLGTTTLARSNMTSNAIVVTQPRENDIIQEGSSLQSVLQHATTEQADFPMTTEQPLLPSLPVEESSMNVDVPIPFLSTSETLPNSSPLNSTQDATPVSNPVPLKPISPLEDGTSTEEPTNHYPTTKPVRSRAHRLPGGPKGTQQNLTPKEMMDFTSSSNLTYDSFWSSHSGSTPAGRPSKSQAVNAAMDPMSAVQSASKVVSSAPEAGGLTAFHFVSWSGSAPPTSANLQESQSVGASPK